jgi:hypothetical protein
MLECEVTIVKVMIQCFPEEFTNRFSTARLQRRAPDCLRFAHKAKKPTILCCVITQKSYNINPSLRKTGYLTSKELRDALHACMQISQQEVYAQEINDLCKLSQVSSNSQWQLLHLFLDKEDYL